MAAVPDPRQRHGRRWPWPVLRTVIAAALVSGQRGMRGIGQWVSEHADELGPSLGLAPGWVPSPASLRRAVRAVEVEHLAAQVAAFVAALPPPPPPPAAVPPAPAPAWIGLALDGKAVRGANRPGGKVQLVGLVRHDDGRVPRQVAVAAKRHEITAAPRLFARHTLRGTVTTMDALLTQRELASQSVAQGGPI